MVRWRPLIKCRVCLCICCTYIHCVAKKVIYHLPRTVLFKIFRNQLHFQNMLQRTTVCKSFKTPRCGSSSAILFLVETGTMPYVWEHKVWTTRSQLSQGQAWVRGYEVYNSRVKLHQPRPQAAFQKTNKTMASNSRYDSFFFSFLIGYRCMIITSSRLIFV